MARKQSNFTKLANKITAQYLDKGFSREEAEKIGKATAYKIGVRKYGKAGMSKRAAAGRKRAEGTEVMWDEDEWVLVKDNTVADVIADEYLDMGEDYDDADEYARRASKKMSAERRPTRKAKWTPSEGVKNTAPLIPASLPNGKTIMKHSRAESFAAKSNKIQKVWTDIMNEKGKRLATIKYEARDLDDEAEGKPWDKAASYMEYRWNPAHLKTLPKLKEGQMIRLQYNDDTWGEPEVFYARSWQGVMDAINQSNSDRGCSRGESLYEPPSDYDIEIIGAAYGAESFAAASTAAPNLAREKSNIRDAVRSQIDPNFDWNQCLWGPFAVRFEASDSNKFYMVWVYDHNGAFRALGAYGGLGQSPRLQDILTTRDRGAAEKAAAKKLKAKERKGYFNYSAEYSNAIVQFEDGAGFSSASAPPNDIHFGADTNPDEYNPYAYIPGIEDDVLAAENQVFSLTYWMDENVRIDEITDLTEALELYLSLRDDIEQMEEMGLQKHPRYQQALRLQNQLSDRMEELQIPVAIQTDIEFDSENMERVAGNVLKGVAGAIVTLFGIKMWTNRK